MGYDISKDKIGGHTNEELYYKQVEMLKAFRDRHVISQAEYEKSFHGLTVKMGMEGKAQQ